MKILFTGGYTLGSVTPLLAVAEKMRGQQLFWVGTRRGPERQLVRDAGIKYYWIWVPKWRRYFDWRNLFTPLFLGFSFLWSLIFLLIHRPDALVTAGGFVGVPLIWAGRLLNIPSLLHSQDVHWSLANRLVAPFVSRITYALPDIIPARWKHKAILTGNPVRSFILNGNKEKGLKICGFLDSGRSNLRVGTEIGSPNMPTILVIGGGTGAQRINEIVWEALPDLLKDYQVAHLTGRGKNNPTHPPLNLRGGERRGYCQFEFVDKEMGDLYAAADLVITRAGMGVLTELVALGKCMIIVPIPDTHQQGNAAYFEKRGAAVVLNQKTLSGAELVSVVKKLFSKIGTMQECAERAKEFSKFDAAKQIAEEILGLPKNKL